jgi:RNA methyltransferase, TrmH family
MNNSKEIRTLWDQTKLQDELVILEGFHALKHALRFGATVERIFVRESSSLEAISEELAPDVKGLLENAGLSPQTISDNLFKQLSSPPHPTGILSIAHKPTLSVNEVMADTKHKPIVLLEEPAHLGNVGAVVRVSAAAGAAGVFTTGKADPWHPVALRGGAGLQFALPVMKIELPLAGDRPWVGFDPEGELMNLVEIPKRSILVFGTERQGISEKTLARCDIRIRIPMESMVSSLNLATAVAVGLYRTMYSS